MHSSARIQNVIANCKTHSGFGFGCMLAPATDAAAAAAGPSEIYHTTPVLHAYLHYPAHIALSRTLCATAPLGHTHAHNIYMHALSLRGPKSISPARPTTQQQEQKMVYERKCIVAAIRRRGAPVHLLKPSKCALLIHIINAAAFAAAARHSNFGRFSAMSADMETAAESI